MNLRKNYPAVDWTNGNVEKTIVLHGRKNYPEGGRKNVNRRDKNIEEIALYIEEIKLHFKN